MEETESTNTVYWAVVRDRTERSTYIELADLGKGKWVAVLDDDEFIFRTTATHFYDVLSVALAELKNRP